MRTRITGLLIGLLALPLFVLAAQPATGATTTNPVVTATCVNGSNWDKC